MSNMRPLHRPTVHLYENREEWLAARTGLGSSEAPAALDQDGYTSRYELWCHLSGVAPRPVEEDVPAFIRAGLHLEDGIAGFFAEETAKAGAARVVWAPDDLARHMGWLPDESPATRWVTLEHPHLPWCRSTPDRFQFREDRTDPGVLELKNTNAFQRRDWADGTVPLKHKIQVQHQLAVSGLHWGTICGLIGGNELAWVDVERDDEFISVMLGELAAFWDTVQRNVAPDVDASEKTWDGLRRRFVTSDDEKEVEVDPVALAAYNEAKAEEKAAKKRAEAARAKLCAQLEDAAYGTLGGKRVVRWKTQRRAKMAKVGESTSRVFAVMSAGQEVA